jgi:hypothetical protein
MPVIYDPKNPSNLCKAGKHDLPDVRRFTHGTIYECDRQNCKAQFKLVVGQRDTYWAKFNMFPMGERQR